MIAEVEHTTKKLNSLSGVVPWDFTAMNVLERKLDFRVPSDANKEEASTIKVTEAADKEIEDATTNGSDQGESTPEIQQNSDETNASEARESNDEVPTQ